MPKTTEAYDYLDDSFCLADGTSGFYLPNEIVDDYLPAIGPRGFTLYGALARCWTQEEYPSVRELGKVSRMTIPAVRNTLQRLLRFGLLTKRDLELIERPRNKAEDDT
jgi:hypothetical protein